MRNSKLNLGMSMLESTEVIRRVSKMNTNAMMNSMSVARRLETSVSAVASTLNRFKGIDSVGLLSAASRARGIETSITDTLNTFRGIDMARLSSVMSGVKGIQTSMRVFSETMSRFNDINSVGLLSVVRGIEGIQASMKILANSMERFRGFDINFFASMSKILEIDNKDDIEGEYTSININPDGSIYYNEDIFEKESIEQEIQDCISILSNDIEVSNEQRIYNFVKSIGDKHPITRYLIHKFIIPLILALLIAIQQPAPSKTILVNNYNIDIDQNYKKVVNNIKLTINKNEFKKEDMFYYYRYICCKHLKVHSRPCYKSYVIGTLQAGEVVKLIQRQKEWSAIEYFDEIEDSYFRGYVLNKYLSSFK